MPYAMTMLHARLRRGCWMGSVDIERMVKCLVAGHELGFVDITLQQGDQWVIVACHTNMLHF